LFTIKQIKGRVALVLTTFQIGLLSGLIDVSYQFFTVPIPFLNMCHSEKSGSFNKTKAQEFFILNLYFELSFFNYSQIYSIYIHRI